MNDTRKYYRTEDLPQEWAKALQEAEYGPVNPALEKLMDDGSIGVHPKGRAS